MLHVLEQKLMDGNDLSFDELLPLVDFQGDDTYELIHTAWRVTRRFSGSKIDLCSIINAKSGLCPEDCRFCAQSVHNPTGIETYPLLDESEVLRQAKAIEAKGADRFSLVTSGRGPSELEFEQILGIFRSLKRETRLELCASLGIIDQGQAGQLADAGVSTYHHNLETSRQYYPSVCTTHGYDDRVGTVLAAKAAGMRVCSGGILFMGETWRDRLELALELRGLEVDSVPINFPMKGTPLDGIETVQPLEALKALAIFRLVMPRTGIRLAGGRANTLRHLQPLAFQAGINALMVGDYLTTTGQSVAEDIRMLSDLGCEIKHSRPDCGRGEERGMPEK